MASYPVKYIFFIYFLFFILKNNLFNVSQYKKIKYLPKEIDYSEIKQIK